MLPSLLVNGLSSSAPCSHGSTICEKVAPQAAGPLFRLLLWLFLLRTPLIPHPLLPLLLLLMLPLPVSRSMTHRSRIVMPHDPRRCPWEAYPITLDACSFSQYLYLSVHLGGFASLATDSRPPPPPQHLPEGNAPNADAPHTPTAAAGATQSAGRLHHQAGQEISLHLHLPDCAPTPTFQQLR